MRQFLRLVCTGLLMGAVVFAGLGFGCSTGAETDENDIKFLIADVDSIHAPAQINSTDTLSIRLVGTVGPNGCYSLDRIEEERSNEQITVTPVVRHVTDRMCTMAIVPLDERYDVSPPFEGGTLQIVVPQSDQPDVTTTVEVREDG